jgi:hypothetical protein
MHAIYPVLDLSGCLMSCLERTSKPMDRNRVDVFGRGSCGAPLRHKPLSESLMWYLVNIRNIVHVMGFLIGFDKKVCCCE